MRFLVLNGRFKRDYQKDLEGALIDFGSAKGLIEDQEYSWMEIVTYEQVKAWLADGNLARAEESLKAFIQHPGTNQNPNHLYTTYSALVRLYALKGDPDMAKRYFALMKAIPQNSLNYLSIEAGVYAKIAINGGNYWQNDPIFKHAKKSSISPGLTSLFILSLILTGLLIAYRKYFKSSSNPSLPSLWHWRLVE